MSQASALPIQPMIEQMVTQQVRAWNVTDERVLNALRRIPRDAFVPTALRHTACADANLPTSHGQVMLAPKMEGKILQALDIKSTDQALVIGAANAHLAACLALLANKVTLQDADANALEVARQQVLNAGLNNLHIKVGSLQQLAESKAYDLIVVAGSLPALTDNLQQALALDGRLFVVLGRTPVMEAALITRTAEQSWQQRSLFETVLPILPGAERPAIFQF